MQFWILFYSKEQKKFEGRGAMSIHNLILTSRKSETFEFIEGISEFIV